MVRLDVRRSCGRSTGWTRRHEEKEAIGEVSRLLQLLKDAAERGQSMIEYALVLVLVAVVVVAVLATLGTQIKGAFTNVLRALGG